MCVLQPLAPKISLCAQGVSRGFDSSFFSPRDLLNQTETAPLFFSAVLGLNSVATTAEHLQDTFPKDFFLSLYVCYDVFVIFLYVCLCACHGSHTDEVGGRIRYLLSSSTLFEAGHFFSPTYPTLAELELLRTLPSLLRLQASESGLHMQSGDSN